MTLSRQHFELIAETVADLAAHDRHAAEFVAKRFAEKLARTNPRFDRERFMRACLPEVRA